MSNGYGVSVWGDENFLEVDGDDGLAAVSVLQVLCHLQIINLILFCIYFATINITIITISTATIISYSCSILVVPSCFSYSPLIIH